MKPLLLLAVLCCVVHTCTGLVAESVFTIQGQEFYDFVQFGFAAHGSITLTITTPYIQYQNLSLYICTDKEFDVLSSYYDTNTRKICNDGSVCEHTQEYTNGATVEYYVDSKNIYHLVMVQCGSEPSVKVRAQYTLLNPGGEQLPLGEVPLPKLYIFVTCIWAVLVTFCGINWFKQRHHLVMLHSLLSVVGVLKLAVVIVALCYWTSFQNTGTDIVQLKYLQSFIFALSETAFFCSLLLISKGWRITRSNLPPSEIRTISVALVLLLSTLLFFSFYNDGYYFLSLMIMYFFMLPKIFTSITRNTRALHTHMLLARYANVELNPEPVLAKMRMFKTLRTAVILYLGSILIISSMKIIMWWFLVWVTYCVSECISIVMIAAVCILTRPRENGVFSPRSYFEGGPFPILNMQQFDHFDELFGDQIWDPDMVFGSGAAALAAAAASAPPPFDVNECIVVEYPVPRVDPDDVGRTYYPRLAIATLEKPSSPATSSSSGSASSSPERPPTLRRRTTTSSNGSTGPSSSSSFPTPAATVSTFSFPPTSPVDIDIVVDNPNNPSPSSSSSHSSSIPLNSTPPNTIHLSTIITNSNRNNNGNRNRSISTNDSRRERSNSTNNTISNTNRRMTSDDVRNTCTSTTTTNTIITTDPSPLRHSGSECELVNIHSSSSHSSTSPLVDEEGEMEEIAKEEEEDEETEERLTRQGSDVWLYSSNKM